MTPGQDWIGRSVGQWRIEGRIGSGGRAEVFRACRHEGQFRRFAAIKVLRPHIPAAEAENERDRLRQLKNCRVVPALEDNVPSAIAGHPCLVMEFVEGRPIHRFADEQGWTVDQRLQLFSRFCDALLDVYRRGVLHLDLKPENVLIEDRTHRIKLIDFGQARADGAGLQIANADDPLTLDYASPEQVVPGPLSAATDVYAAGCILHLLLTGRTPLELSSVPADDRRAVIRDRLPAPASEAAFRASLLDPRIAKFRDATPASLRTDIRGGLDTILAGALAKNASDRYPTVRELQEDIELIRVGKRPRMRPNSIGHQAAQFTRSRPVWFASIGLLIMAVWADKTVEGMQVAFPSQSEMARRHFEPLVRMSMPQWRRMLDDPRLLEKHAEVELVLNESKRLIESKEQK